MKITERFEALDTARGLTLAGMILVNNPGSWEHVYAPLLHAEFNGLTPTDLVFPFFMFIMGYSIFLSQRKNTGETLARNLQKVLKRTVIIFFLGLLLNWVGSAAYSNDWSLEHLRIPGVLQRLAICYGVTATLALTVHDIKHLITGALFVLAGYVVVLLLGHGYELSTDNIGQQIDLMVFSASHMYRDGGIPFDPEGLLSTIPSICHTTLGYLCARMVHSPGTTIGERERTLFGFATIAALFFAATYIYDVPLNKKMWSTSFVFCTCALCSILIALLSLVNRSKHLNKAGIIFRIFGTNCIAIYVISDLLAILGGVTGISYTMYEGYLSFCSPNMASLLYALSFVAINWCIAAIMYKCRIFIKI